MEGFAKLLVFLGLSVAITKGAVTVYAQPGTNTHFLGTVDGKSYFTENSTHRDWYTSKDYCISIGMKLASVRTIAEKDFFAGLAGDDPNFQDLYWTAGRDIRLPQQFGWEDDNQPLSNFVMFYRFEEPHTCVAYDGRSIVMGDKRFFSKDCNYNYGTLCESHCAPAAH